MRQFYRYVADCDDYCDFFLQERDHERIKEMLVQGKPLKRRWAPPAVRVSENASQETKRRGRKNPDFAEMAVSPVFSERAWEALQPLLGRTAEALPIRCRIGDFFVINVLEVVDALDRKNSELALFSDGDVMLVHTYALHAKPLENKHLFRLAETRNIELLVSEEFRALAKREGLKGLIFEKLEQATARPKRK